MITTHVEISFLVGVVSCTIVGASFLSVPLQLVQNAFNGLSAGWFFPNLFLLSMASGDGMLLG